MATLDSSSRKLLEGRNFAFVSSLNRDGSPHVTPTWVDTDGKYVLINTLMGSQKQKNTSRDARVAVAVTDQTNPYNFTVIRGRVVEQIEGQAAEDHIDRLAKKYLGADKYPHRQPGQQRVMLRITPERIFLPRWGEV